MERIKSPDPKPGFQLNLCTKGHCFLCLKKTNLLSNNNKIRIKKERIEGGNNVTGSSNSNAEDSTTSTLPTSRLLQHLCKHLKINIGKIATEVIKTPAIIERMGLTSISENAEMKVTLCDLCSSITEKFSSLFMELERIKMESDQCLVRIKKRISAAEEDSELLHTYQQLMAGDIHSLLLSGFIDELKKEISRKCSLTKSTQPSTSNVSNLVSLSRVAQSFSSNANGRKSTPEFKTPSAPAPPPAAKPSTFSSFKIPLPPPSLSIMELPITKSKPHPTKVVDICDSDDDEETDKNLSNAAAPPQNQTGPAVASTSTANPGNQFAVPHPPSPPPPQPSASSASSRSSRKIAPAPEFDRAALQNAIKKLKFKCKLCDKTFPRTADVKAHKKKAHTAPPMSLQDFITSPPQLLSQERQPSPTPTLLQMNAPPQLKPAKSKAVLRTSSGRLVKATRKLNNSDFRIRNNENDDDEDFLSDQEEVQNLFHANHQRGYDSDNTYVPSRKRQKRTKRDFKKRSSTPNKKQKTAETVVLQEEELHSQPQFELDEATGKFKCPMASCTELYYNTEVALMHYRIAHLGSRARPSPVPAKHQSTRKKTKMQMNNKRKVGGEIGSGSLDDICAAVGLVPSPSKKGNKRFKCIEPSCTSDFSSLYMAKIHHQAEHLHIRYKCQKCNKDDFKWQTNYQTHVKSCKGGSGGEEGKRQNLLHMKPDNANAVQSPQQQNGANSNSEDQSNSNTTASTNNANIRPTSSATSDNAVIQQSFSLDINPSPQELIRVGMKEETSTPQKTSGKISIKKGKLPRWKIRLEKELEKKKKGEN